METILNFLREIYDPRSENSKQQTFSIQDLKKINKSFENIIDKNNDSKQLRINPRLQKSQIWTVKGEYDDFMGYKHKAYHPFIVILNTEPGEIEEEDFVRVNVISPFIEFASSEDIICNDQSIIGFPFLIETWNDQPLLSEILDEYLGDYEISDFSILQDFKLNKYQHEFRNIEISRAEYLNNSIIALLTFLENRQAYDSGVIISLFDKPQFPQFYYDNNPQKQEFSLAARSGIDTEDKFIHYNTSELPFEIFIRRNESGFMITILPLTQVKLYTSDNVEIIGISKSEKIVFEKLNKGLYTLTANEIIKPIKIRLK